MTPSAIWNVIEVVAIVLLLAALNLWQMRRAIIRPSALAQMESVLRSQQERIERQAIRIDQLEAEIDALRNERDDERDEMAMMRRDLDALRDGIRKLIGQIEAAGMVPVWRPSNGEKRPAKRLTKAGLAARISRQFSIDEMNALAYQLGIEAEEFGGDTRDARARALVDMAWRRGISAALVAAVNEARPE